MASTAVKTEAGSKSRALDALLKVLAYAVLVAMAAFFLVPFAWSLVTSLKTPEQVFQGNWIPDPVTFNAYRNVWEIVPYGRWFLNSLIYTTFVTAINIALATTAGYALARMRFPGRQVIFYAILGTLMIPVHVYLIPIYQMMSFLGLVDTYTSVILVQAAYTFGVFLMRQFFLEMPYELEEAAKVDGASRFRTFWQIILPLARPALAALTIFSFLSAWNQFFWPFILLNSDAKFPLTVGLAAFRSQYDTQWEFLMAGSLLALLPTLLVFLVAQRQIIEGVSFTAVKG
jgi:multiple sugar transport system permease protein